MKSWKGITLLVCFVLLMAMVFSMNMNMTASADEECDNAYIGVGKCKMCHKAEFTHWEGTAHAKAFSLLEGENAGKEECVKCHTVGFGKTGGYNLETPDEAFENVQCESCHGPGQAHMKAKADEKAATIVGSPTEEVCVVCHTEEGNPNFKEFIFEERVELIKHPVEE